jgi:ABC-type transport system substrate-binding protein
MKLRILAALALAAVGFTLAVAACGSDDDSAATTTAAATRTTPPATEVTTTEPTTTPPATTTPKPSVETFTIVVKQGRPEGGIKTFKAKQGQRVALVVRSDTGESVHLHGYDIEQPLRNGRSRIEFQAKIPGRFEIELHESDILLGNLQVEP